MPKSFNKEIMKDPKELICVCMDVRSGDIEEAIRMGGLKSIEEIGDKTEAGANCGACHDDLEDILATTNGN
jgi:NAD(P)H-nitrite reductase large subunit